MVPTTPRALVGGVVDSARGVVVALSVLTLGVALVGIGATEASLWLRVLAALVTGVGIGLGLTSGVLEVQRMAGPREQGRLVGAFCACTYVGFLAPAPMAAVTPPFTTEQLFGGLVALGLGSTAVVVTGSRKHLPTGAEALDVPAGAGLSRSA